ncbi:MAG: hypothetical protein QM820_42235 [Minicystis sp.]
MEAWLERLRKYQRHIAVVVVVLAWAVAFRSGFGSSEWSGAWWVSPQQTRGSTVVIKEKAVETTAERRKRLDKQKSELKEALQGLKTDVLGDSRPTRGDTPRERQAIPRDVAGYTQRDACLQMKLEYPDKFGDVDCMSDEFDDIDPWFRAPRKPGH